MRIIVGRAEIDLACIKSVYEDMYHETLENAVRVCRKNALVCLWILLYIYLITGGYLWGLP